MNKRVLLVAYHYPPISQSSGVHRTHKFARYLPEFGWDPLVLSCNLRAYAQYDEENSPDLPGVIVQRAFALDTSKHLAIRGRYPRFLALPDRWVSWWVGGVLTGLSMIRRYRPQLIWSTYPIATAHLIGLTLHKLTGLPWVTDFRDPMTDTSYPPDPVIRKIYSKIERSAVRNSSHMVFTTDDTLKKYVDRFPQANKELFSVIENGYDEDAFSQAEQSILSTTKPHSKPFILIHSGILYPSERNPEPFFLALSELHRDGHISPDRLRIVLRASGHERNYENRLKELNIANIAVLEPPIPYVDALREMLQSDGLLIFQAANCNHQIPAKAYEYFRARRPIFALTDHPGNTAQLLRNSGIDTIVDIASKDEIKTGLLNFLRLLESGNAPIANIKTVEVHSRRARTQQLGQLFDRLLMEPK